MHVYLKASPQKPRHIRRPIVVSWMLMGAGSFILAWSIWPILSFFLVREHLFGTTISPVAEQSVLEVNRGGSLFPPANAAAPVSASWGATPETINPNLWFPTSPQKKIVTRVNSYMLSIPKLKIKDATVVVAGDDLSKSLIHYGGTGLPGEYGNTVIFGHSTLPQFYSPTNYKAIFSLLPTLTTGDEILVNFDGVRYRYVVEAMVVTKPNDLSPLEQRFDDVFLTLITCVPPGTYWERLNVKARLVKS